jgi:hypothetical protein
MKSLRNSRLRLWIEPLEERALLSGSAWTSYAHDPQHTGQSTVASQPLQFIRWQTPVDLMPQYSGNDLLIHYGSPLVTAANTVIVPVKTGATDGFRLEGHSGTDGKLLWTQSTDYVLPPHGWTPSYEPVLTVNNRLYFAGAGGTVYYVDNPDSAGNVPTGQLAFYGIANYTHAAFDGTVFIDTPLSTDAAGDIFFGFQVTGSTPLNLKSGIARIDPNGNGTMISATAAALDPAITEVTLNCAPALSNDGKTLYVAVSDGNGTNFTTSGYLLALDSTTLQPKAKVRLTDPKSGSDSILPDDGSATPTVGPDGDVYFGVLESPFATSKGWLLHFSGDLSTTKTPGAFGWDDTASVVPASLVPSYQGTSTYLLMTKYNNYAGLGGDGVNRIAILDPNATMTDPRNAATVMKTVETIAGPTPDAEFRSPALPNAVREWCINTAVVDPLTHSVLANSEDGKLYRWDLANNTFTQQITLTPGIGEAYTPTIIGADGTVYAINNATLFAVGASARLSINSVSVNQGSSGPATATFTVSLSGSVSQPVSVAYATADGTATANLDYTAHASTLTFAPGVTMQTITVAILPTNINEAPQTFFVNLSNPFNATIATAQGVGTIVDTVPPPTISINSVSGADPDSAVIPFTFTVQLSGPSGQPITVAYATADGSAVGGTDYTAATGSVTFAPGETSKQVVISVNGNTLFKPTKSFVVNLSNPSNATLAVSQGVGTILDNHPPGVLQFGNLNYLADETDGSVTITLTRTNGRASGVGATFTTSDGSAAGGTQYKATSGTVVFGADQSQATFTIPILDSHEVDGPKTFTVTLNQPTGGGTLGSPITVTVTILDNDATPNQRYLAQTYVDLLRRQIDPTGLAVWGGFLDKGGSRGGVVRGIEGSTEYRTNLINSMYFEYLGRAVDPFGLDVSLRMLSATPQAEGAGDVRQLRLMLLTSPEYMQRHAASDNLRYLVALYADILGRDLDPTGAAGFGALLAAGASRAQVAAAILASTESDKLVVGSLFHRYLKRAPDPIGQTAFVDQLQSGGTESDILAAVVSSDEYFIDL